MQKLPIYPKTLIRIYKEAEIEFQHLSNGEYQAVNLIPKNIETYHYLMTLPEVLGKWRGTVVIFEVNSYWIEGAKIEQPYYANYVFGQKALEEAWEWIKKENLEATLKTVEIINPNVLDKIV